MNYIKIISRKAHLIPMYLIWNGLQRHIDEFIAESKEGYISYHAKIDCRKKTSQELTEKILSDPDNVVKYYHEVMALADKDMFFLNCCILPVISLKNYLRGWE